jgi:hypothetical protein
MPGAMACEMAAAALAADAFVTVVLGPVGT